MNFTVSVPLFKDFTDINPWRTVTFDHSDYAKHIENKGKVCFHPYGTPYLFTPDGKEVNLLRQMFPLDDYQYECIDLNYFNYARSNVKLTPKLQKTWVKTSGYQGVSWDVKSKKWRATIYNNQQMKKIHIGFYSSELEAAIAYDQTYREMFNLKKSPNFGTKPFHPEELIDYLPKYKNLQPDMIADVPNVTRDIYVERVNYHIPDTIDDLPKIKRDRIRSRVLIRTPQEKKTRNIFIKIIQAMIEQIRQFFL